MELGLKFTRVADEFTSDFQISKDRAGPLFMSRETDSMFILTAHLKGYKRWNIKIDINKDGTLIGLSGEKQVKETVMVGWKVYKKDTEITGFKKVFRIPDGVILDKIKAKFNEDESTLTITMPKKVKGIRGTTIEEIPEKQELVKDGSGNLQIVDEKTQKTGTSNQEKDDKSKARIEKDDTADEMHAKGGKEMPEEEKQEEKPVSAYSYTEDAQKVHDLKDGEEEQPISTSIHGEVPSVETESPMEDVENQKKVDDKERTEPKPDQELDHVESLSTKQLAKEDLQETKDQVPAKANEIHEEERFDEAKEGPFAVEPPEEAQEAEPGKVQEGEHKPRRKRCKMCIPIVAGSTLLLSFVVLVIQIIRSKNQSSRRRD